VDGGGDVRVPERAGNALRVVDARGKVRTAAGTGEKGSSGDGGPAWEATFNGPKRLGVDRGGSVLIADTENHTVGRYLPEEGKVARVAGTGRKGKGGPGGDPLKAELSQPHGVYVDPSGVLYIADSGNDRVLKLER
jgi:hypothetical protein